MRRRIRADVEQAAADEVMFTLDANLPLLYVPEQGEVRSGSCANAGEQTPLLTLDDTPLLQSIKAGLEAPAKCEWSTATRLPMNGTRTVPRRYSEWLRLGSN